MPMELTPELANGSTYPVPEAVSVPETASAAETTCSAAETTVSVPETTVFVPETASAAETTCSVPETTVSAPETTVSVPETASAAETTCSAPETTVSAPETTSAREMIPSLCIPTALEVVVAPDTVPTAEADSGSSAPVSGGFRTGDREESVTSLDSSWNVTLDASVVDIDDIQLLCTIGNCMDTSEGQVECGNSTPGNAVSCGDDDAADIACAPENVLLELNGIADGTGDHGWQEPGSVSETTQHGSVDAAGDAASRTDAELAQAVQKTRARTSKQQIDAYAAKHAVLPPPSACSDGSCQNGCRLQVTEDQRHTINEQVNHMSTEARREWFRAHVHVQDVNRRRKRSAKEMESETDSTESPRRMRTLEWYLPMGDKNVKVCKGFFLASLGFNPGNDTSVRSAVEKSATSAAVAPKDKRGTGMATNKCDQDAIKSHILSYAPAAPHYRYMHSPKRRYLPPDLSIRKMHQDFTETHGKMCSLESYRKIVKELNIGFTNLSKEECEACKLHELHKDGCETLGQESGECDVCASHKVHIEEATQARGEYRRDAERVWADDELVLSADMMRVNMLPVLPHKACLFTRRIVAYNETFSILQPSGRKRNSQQRKRGLAVLWHEGVAERKAGDVASCYLAMLKANRDVKEFTIYCDNCASQNKCWVVLSVLLQAVQSEDLAVERITLKYLTTGHTAMSADADHQVINKNMKTKKEVEDFEDWANIIASTGLSVHCMSEGDFVEAENLFSESKSRLLQGINARPYLRDFKVVQVRKGSELLYTKSSYDQSDWRTYNLVKAKVDLSRPLKMRSKERGVNKEKIDELCRNLLGLISRHKRPFWLALQNGAKTSVRDVLG